MRLLALCLIIVGTATNCLALDVIKLRSGEELTGTIADRDKVVEAPLSRPTIGILLGSSSDYTRVALKDVDVIILENGSRPLVLDIAAHYGSPASNQVDSRDYPALSDNSGAALIVSGLLIGTVGALVKFGGAKLTASDQSIDYDEKSYSALNYGMISVGAVLVVVGVMTTTNAGTVSYQEHAVLPLLAVGRDRTDWQVTLGCSLRF